MYVERMAVVMNWSLGFFIILVSWGLRSYEIKKAPFIILNAAGFLKEPPNSGFFVSLVFLVLIVILPNLFFLP